MRRVRAKFSDEPTGFVWVDEGRLAASGCPASRRQVKWLSAHGIDTILTLTEKPLPREWTEGTGLSLQHVPMVDHAPPDIESLDRAATIIASETKGGKKVLVHCLAGQGRTMCAIAAYLVKERKMAPEDAVRKLRELRPGAVERGQEAAVSRYSEWLAKSP